MSKHIDYYLRQANPDDAEQLTKLAFLSKAHWGYSNELLELWRDQLTVTPEMIKQSASFVIEKNNDIVGFWCRSTTQTSNISTGMLFVHPEHMGKGVGKLLFNAIRQELLNHGITEFTLEADPNAVQFYEKMGAKKISEKESPTVPGRMMPIMRFTLKK